MATLRRSVNEFRRRKRASAALVQARWEGILAAKHYKCFDDGHDPSFSKHKSTVCAPFYTAYRSDEREVPWFTEKTDMLLENTDYSMEAVSDVDAMATPLHSPQTLWKTDRKGQLFPFNPGGYFMTNGLKHGLSSVSSSSWTAL